MSYLFTRRRSDGWGCRRSRHSVRRQPGPPLFKPDPEPVGWLYFAAPDGQRFLVDTLGEAAEAPLVLVLNAPLDR